MRWSLNRMGFGYVTTAALLLSSCAGPTQGSPPAYPADLGEEIAVSDRDPERNAGAEAGSTDISDFLANERATSKHAGGATSQKIKSTRTEAALKFLVTDKDKGPIAGIVVALTDPNGRKYYTDETDTLGYTEVLVPVGREYHAVYLSLGRREIAATVRVTDEPFQNISLTLRYRRIDSPPREPTTSMTLEGVTFDTGKASLRPESFAKFDPIIEFMTHKPTARLQISGHTDNVGNPRANKALSQARAEACRSYLVSQGIARDRIDAVGYGDEQPIASNETEDGRSQNRRIEATAL